MPSADLRYESRPTGTTRTLCYRVWSLDVWGHAAADCELEPFDPDSSEPSRHECECGGYEINDRASQGYIEIVADGTEHNVGTAFAFVSYCPTHEQMLAALRDAGHFNEKATTETIVIDGDPEYGFDVDAASDGKPIYKLEREKSREESADV